MTASSKKCSECKQVKLAQDFHASKAHGGLAPRCKICAIAVSSKWYRENKSKKQAYDAKRRKEKRHLYREASKKFAKAHPDRKNADTSARRKRVQSQTPPWVRPRDMVCFYLWAKRVSKCLGIVHHVDHIVPLHGKNVSGLHVPANLQVLPATVNLRKRNHYSFEHEGVK